MRETQVKRSPPTSSCSSSCSYVGFDNAPEKTVKPRAKRSRTNETPQTCELNNGNGTMSSATNRRSSIYRGVTRHRWTGRFEAHLWDKSCWNNIQNKKGRQVYLGAYDNEEAAARTYDLAALKYWGPGTTLNFPIEGYTKEVEEMDKLTKEEYLATLRRQSSGFSRGVSKYRGVARHHHNGRWEARIGRVFGNKYLYLGTYNTQEEAAAAYDLAAIEYRGANAVTNFDISNYIDRLQNKIPSADKSQDTEMETETETETQTESAPISSTESEETEVDQLTKQPTTEQGQQQQHPQPHQEILKEPKRERESPELEYNQMPTCMEESSMAVMEPVVDNDHSWSFIDTGFTQFQVPLDLPLDKTGELLDVFDNRGFEENIDFLFGLDSNENDFDLNKILEGEQDTGNASNSGANNEQEERSLSLSSPSSIPSSSSTGSPSFSTTPVSPVIILFEKRFEL